MIDDSLKFELDDNVSAGEPAAQIIMVRPTDHDLTVIIPAYNEEKRLPTTLSDLTLFLDEWGVDYRILVADDGSSDATAQLADSFGPRCSALRVTPQGGKGRAVRTAMLHATGRVLAFTDADLPFRSTALRQGCEWIRDGQCDVVFGARDIDGAASLARRRKWRSIATVAFKKLVGLMVSGEVTDTQCGLKIFKRRAALEIFGRCTIDGFAFDTEVVVLTHRLGLPFRRVPVVLVNEFASTLKLHRNALPMLMDVVKLWLRDTTGRHAPPPHFVFLPAADGSFGEEKKAAA